MLPAYKTTENIETVYTFSEWEKIYNKTKQKEKEEKVYFLKQKLLGVIMAVVGIVTPFILGDATVSIVALPVGAVLLFTKEKVML